MTRANIILRLFYRAIASQFIGAAVVKAVRMHFRIKNKLAWEMTENHPHFTDFSALFTSFVFEENPQSSGHLQRAIAARDAIPEGGRVLDIGFGDGFLTKRVYAERCSEIEAIDVEKSAVMHAMRFNRDAKIRYLKADAVSEDFPSDSYDVVIWNGAIGHFAASDANIVLAKIKGAIGEHGIFSGSETLGTHEGGYDHLQFFNNEDALVETMAPFFRFTATKIVRYRAGLNNEVSRVELLWRCSQNCDALFLDKWRLHS